MKCISLLMLLLSMGTSGQLLARSTDSLVYKLKLAQARELGLDKSLEFKLAYGRHKEQLYLDSIHKVDDISSLFVSSTSVLEIKSYRIQQLFIPIGQRIPAKEEYRLTTFVDSVFDTYLSKPSESHFKELIERYSEDKNIHWVSQLDETVEFQQVVSKLKKNEISRPFVTPKGIHIVQKLGEADHQEVAKEADITHLDDVMSRFGIFADQEAFQQMQRNGQTNLPLVVSEFNSFSQEDFQRFALGNTSKGGELLQKEFLKYCLVKDLKSRLNQNPYFIAKLTSLYDEDLYKLIYRIKVYNQAQSESEGLAQFFEQHKKDYQWSKPQFKGLLVFCKNNKIRKELHELLSSSPLKDWAQIIEIFNKDKEQISYEMGIFEQGDNPTIDSFVFKKGKKRKFKRKGFPKVQVYGEILEGPELIESQVKDAVFADYLKYKEAEWEKDLLSKYNASKNYPNSLNSLNNQTSN